MKKLLLLSVLIFGCSNGNNGASGVNGHSGAFSQGIADTTLCANSGVVINMGIDFNDDGILQIAETKQTAILCNGLDGNDGADGQDGSDGQDASSPFMTVALVDPCGTNPSIRNEIFMRLANGMLLASFSENMSGDKTRWIVLGPGNYMTTDGDNCTFTVNSSLNIVNENKHY